MWTSAGHKERKTLACQKTIFLVSIFFTSFFPTPLSQGETLKIVDVMILSPDNAPYTGKKDWRPFVTGVYLAGDTTFVTGNVGLLAKFSSEQPWRKILRIEPWGNNWWEDNKKARKKNVLFSVGGLWRIPGADRIAVFDTYIDATYTINLQDPDNVRVRFWKRPDDKSSVYTVSIYNDLIFYGINSGFHDSILAISHLDMSDYHRVFECPPALKRKLDSVWTDPYCRPAFNPIDSTIWLAFTHYNYIYLVDMNGNLLDSVQITDPNFRLPQPPRSRMHSNAVFRDWLSKCTPVRSFWYVPHAKAHLRPGYFLLQYRSGWRMMEADSIRLFSTLAWTASRQPVELDVDEDWRIVGVQPDGRVIFGHFLIKDNKVKEYVLSVARIEQ